MATQTKKPITLADLSDEDRKALVEQAREAAKHNPTDVPGYAELSERERLVRSCMDARDHMRGCPVESGATLGRVEGYDARKPPNPALGEPERYLAVIRCVECGGQTVYDGKDDDRPMSTLDEVIERRRAASEPEPEGDDIDL